jgi:nucleotide-binding universal stress UspA family protein
MQDLAEHVMTHRHLDPAFFRLVVGYDGSTRSDEAVRQALAVAGETGAEVEVVHVFDPAVASLTPWRRGESARQGAEDLLAQAVQLADKEGRGVSVVLVVGAPAPALVGRAADRWADLICVGADAGFLEGGRILGRVASTILRDAQCSVLVAREAGDSKQTFPHRIVCAVDRTMASLRAARSATLLAREAGAELTFVHAVEVHGHGIGPGWVADAAAEGPDPLTRASRVARGQGVDTTRRSSLGRPGPAIVQTAEEFGADLIVTGSRGIRGMRRVLSGSVGDWLVHHAACSVLVVRPRDRAPGR